MCLQRLDLGMLSAADTRTDPTIHLGLHNPATHRLNAQPFPGRDHLASSVGVVYSERCSAIIRITRSRTAGSIFFGICTSSWTQDDAASNLGRFRSVIVVIGASSTVQPTVPVASV